MKRALLTKQQQLLPILQTPQQPALEVAQAPASSPTTPHRPIIDINPDAGLDLNLFQENDYPRLSTLVNSDLEELKTLDEKILTHLQRLNGKRTSKTLSQEKRQELENLSQCKKNLKLLIEGKKTQMLA